MADAASGSTARAAVPVLGVLGLGVGWGWSPPTSLRHWSPRGDSPGGG